MSSFNTPHARRPAVAFVSTRPAWPLYPGYRLRTANLLRALCEVADVDAIFLIPKDEAHHDMYPPEVRPRSVTVVPVARRSAAAAIGRWLIGDLPMPMTKVDWASNTAALTAALGSAEHDFVFGTSSTGWRAIRSCEKPLIVDLDDLDDFKIKHRLSDAANYPSGIKGVIERRIDLVDLKRWKRLYKDATTKARCVVVCSTTDVVRLGASNACALPNVYPDPNARLRAPDTAVPTGVPNAVFVGDLTYKPNLEAFTFLIESVLPEVWKARPSFELNVVGKHDFASRTFDPRVHVLGSVEAVEPFLTVATMALAPLQSGGGTRIKILEAFAHRIPVVSTSVGCEGLNVVDRCQLLVADTPGTFAERIIELLDNPLLGAQLAEEAHRLFVANFTFDSLRKSLQAVLTLALAKPGDSP